MCLKEVVHVAFCLWFLIIQEGRAEPSTRGSEKQLQNLKPTIKTIQTAGGDIFDCIEINKQPAFDHPLLKDHKLQMRPSTYPTQVSEERLPENIFVEMELEDGGCPEGTVPIHRVHTDTSTRARRFSAYNSQPLANNKAIDDGKKRRWAAMETYVGSYYGGESHIDVYGLHSVGKEQLSSSTMWVTNFDGSSSNYSTLQAGWMVNPDIFNDTNTRLYIYWTADAFKNTGCYNVQCPGFVQVSRTSPLGLRLSPLSKYRGQQYVVKVLIFKEPDTGHWWFATGPNLKIIGYWPKEIFGNFDRARQLHFGGAVKSAPNLPTPPMGDGHFAKEGRNGACFVQSVKYVDHEYKSRHLLAWQVYQYASNPECYTVGPYYRVDGPVGHRFYFGGPGGC